MASITLTQNVTTKAMSKGLQRLFADAMPQWTRAQRRAAAHEFAFRRWLRAVR
jgi:hypothetical protein